MRILLASHSLKDPNGGASRVYHLLEEGLSARGHAVKALHYHDVDLSGPMKKVTDKLRLPQAVSRRAAREPLADYDVLMSSSGMLYPLFRKIRPQPKRPLLVSHLHGLAFFDNQATRNEVERGHMTVSHFYRHLTGPIAVRWDKEGSRYADLTIAQNGRDVDFLGESMTPIVVNIPLSVHPEIAAAGVLAPSLRHRDPGTFLWFGSWVERKGCHYLPRAFAEIAKRIPTARLTIGGTDIAPEALKQRFEPEIRDRVTVLPRISLDDQIQVFCRHAIFLFPSLSEGFGFALLEAMSMGLAAVTTDTGMAGDFLLDREHAMIVPKASALYLARAACELAETPSLRERLAHNGQTLARTFTTGRLIDRYESTFLSHLPRSSLA